MTILQAELKEKKQKLSATLNSTQKMAAKMGSRIVINKGNIETISVDGVNVPPDENKNVNLNLGLKEINNKLDNYLENSTVKIFFRNTRFEKNGTLFELRIPLSEHQRGYGAIIEKVLEYINGDYKETFSQTCTMSDGSVVVATHRVFDGMIYIKGANEYGE